MKINIKMNGWFVASCLVASFTVLLALGIALQNATDYYEYNKYISDNTKSNIEWYYNCDSTFNSAMYNCPNNLQFKNLTGYYCNGTKICENGYRIK